VASSFRFRLFGVKVYCARLSIDYLTSVYQIQSTEAGKISVWNLKVRAACANESDAGKPVRS